jgi:hypothetical protein
VPGSQFATSHATYESEIAIRSYTKMISDEQLAANRANALLSTGPKTEEGKKCSSLNARRHGLTGQVTTMTDEDRAAHDNFSKALMQGLAPGLRAAHQPGASRKLALLQSLQTVRKAQRKAEMKEAAALLKLSEMRGLEYQPQKDGFVFSNDKIHAAIDRDQRLQRASITDLTKYRPRKFQTRAA